MAISNLASYLKLRQYSEKTLSSTSKVRTPVKTDFLKEVDAGHCRLIPDTADSLKSMLNSCVYHPIKASDQVITTKIRL